MLLLNAASDAQLPLSVTRRSNLCHSLLKMRSCHVSLKCDFHGGRKCLFCLSPRLASLSIGRVQQPAPFCCINDKRLPASPIQLRLVTSTSTINGMNAKSHTYAVRIAYDSSTELQTISNLHVCHPLREPYAILVAATGKSFTQND